MNSNLSVFLLLMVLVHNGHCKSALEQICESLNATTDRLSLYMDVSCYVVLLNNGTLEVDQATTEACADLDSGLLVNGHLAYPTHTKLITALTTLIEPFVTDKYFNLGMKQINISGGHDEGWAFYDGATHTAYPINAALTDSMVPWMPSAGGIQPDNAHGDIEIYASLYIDTVSIVSGLHDVAPGHTAGYWNICEFEEPIKTITFTRMAKNEQAPAAAVLEEHPQTSRIQCGKLCANRPGCVSIAYHKADGVCKLQQVQYGHVFQTPVTAEGFDWMDSGTVPITGESSSGIDPPITGQFPDPPIV